MNWNEIIGKKVVALRGFTVKEYGKDHTPLEYILFDDLQTFIALREQDYYDYHDCSHSARILSLHKDAKYWKELFDKEGKCNEPDSVQNDLVDPF